MRGLEVWGHHVNLIAYAFVPFYWLGAGPSFLYAVQACALALGAVPVYLIARDRFSNPWMGLCLAVVYLLYAPVQWISWAMFHPEALVIDVAGEASIMMNIQELSTVAQYRLPVKIFIAGRLMSVSF